MDDQERPRSPQAAKPVVLIADDDAMVCDILRMALEAMGVFVLTAADGEQALELSRKFPGTIHALVSDMVMPKLDGLELCEQIRRERPATRLLLMSGTGCPRGGIEYLQKPFELEQFKEKVRQLVTEATFTSPAA